MARNSTKYMESVIALAEELNFIRAARRLGISQPMLTRNIAELETSLGVQLFERNHHTVRVTAAGQAYIEKARIALLYAEKAFQAACAMGQNAKDILLVGKSPYTDPALTSLLLSIRLPSHPNLRIELTSQYSCDLTHELVAGAIDLAIATEPPRSHLLTTFKIAETPFYIGMSKQDKLAAMPSLTLDAMAERCWILFERRLHPPLHDAILKLAEKKKIVPARIRHVTVPEEAFPFVADGSSLAFLVKAGALLIARDGVTVRPLIERALYPKTYLASRTDNRSKIVSRTVRAFMTKIADWNQDDEHNLLRASA
jgi:DNA-binding transcriptional LysR family regulator